LIDHFQIANITISDLLPQLQASPTNGSCTNVKIGWSWVVGGWNWIWNWSWCWELANATVWPYEL